MPQALPILGNIALNLAVGVGFSLLSSAITPQQKSQSVAVKTARGFSFEMAVGESAPVSAVLGLGRAKGQLMYLNEFGENNDYLQMVVKIGHGWHDGMEAFLLDEKPAGLSGSNTDPRGRSIDPLSLSGMPYGWVKYYTGAPGQPADAELVAQSNPVGRWTADHKMTGCAYIILTFRYQADLFGSTLPLSGSVWRGLKLYDWRVPGAIWGDLSTYVFTKNPAVIRHNFRRGIYVTGVRVLGQGFSAFANDLAGYTAAANVCDEEIYEPVSGKTFKRYEFGREIGDDEEKLAVLSQIDDSYCGSSFKRGGADVPLPAQQLVSAMTLTDKDRIAGKPVRADRKGSVSQKRTAFHGQFVSKDVGWGLAPFTPQINSDLESVLGGRRSIAIDQPYEYLQERAQARAVIRMRRQFYPATRVETFTPKALALEPGDPITRICEWGSMLMVVEKVEPLEGRLGVTVTMSQWDNFIVPASGDTFVVLPSGPGAGPASPDRTIAVAGLSVVKLDRSGGGAVHPFARATWTAISDPNVDQVMIRVWPVAGSEALDKQDFFASSKLTSTLVFGPLAAETDYTGYAIPIRGDGRLTVKTNLFTFTSGSESVPAEVPDGSVELIKLGQELTNAHGLVVGNSVGSVQDQIHALREDIGDVVNALVTGDDTSLQRISLLSAHTESSSAAVIRTEKAVAEQKSALASLSEEVVAVVGDLSAGGLLKLEGVVTEAGASASVLFKALAALGVNASAAALQLSAVVDGLGGSIGSVDIMADRLRFITTNGDVVSIPFSIMPDGHVRMNIADIGIVRAGLMTSPDGVSMIINLTDPEITLIGA